MKKKDWILGIAVILIAVICWGAMAAVNGQPGSLVKITIDGEVYGTYSLQKNQKIDIDEGEYHNQVSIEDEKVHMQEANCPDAYCIHQGSINKINQTIVCLPHKLVVEIVNEDDNKDETESIDAFTS